MRLVYRTLLLATALSVGVLGLAVTPAGAAVPRADAAALLSSLGDGRTAGSFVDSTGRTVVNVTDNAAAAAVRAAGGTARVVARSTTYLAALQARLDKGVPGTAWSVDPATDRVLVQADSTVSAAAFAGFATGAADAVAVIRVAGQFRTLISGGDAIYGGQYRCSLGFNVQSGSTKYFLTAGHCGNIANTWYSNSSHTTVLGTTQSSSFPGNDYALVRYTNTQITVSGTAGNQDITSSADPTVGEHVTRRGSTTGVHSGTVQQLNVTVHYSDGGTVGGLIQTTVCAEGGDSGGPLYDGTKALGLTSGGSGNCSSGGTTFFQPVKEALNAYGVQVF